MDLIGSIQRVNGAYLIELTAPGTEDRPAHELFSAARARVTAKRVLKDMARDFGCTNLTWRDEGRVVWLDGIAPDWAEQVGPE